jgi:hypothetical protein
MNTSPTLADRRQTQSPAEPYSTGKMAIEAEEALAGLPAHGFDQLEIGGVPSRNAPSANS